jgi:hypothetical protein
MENELKDMVKDLVVTFTQGQDPKAVEKCEFIWQTINGFLQVTLQLLTSATFLDEAQGMVVASYTAIGEDFLAQMTKSIVQVEARNAANAAAAAAVVATEAENIGSHAVPNAIAEAGRVASTVENSAGAEAGRMADAIENSVAQNELNAYESMKGIGENKAKQLIRHWRTTVSYIFTPVVNNARKYDAVRAIHPLADSFLSTTYAQRGLCSGFMGNFADQSANHEHDLSSMVTEIARSMRSEVEKNARHTNMGTGSKNVPGQPSFMYMMMARSAFASELLIGHGNVDTTKLEE